MSSISSKSSSRTESFFFASVALLIGLSVALVNIFPILFQDNVVQDDFRQSYFWVWRFWDPSLFPKSFLIDIYRSHITRTPLVNLIFHLGPYLTDNLVFYSKVLAIIISTFSSLFAYLYFNQLTKDKFLSLFFTVIMSFIFWYTDHVSNACTRCYLWMGLYAYLYFRELNKKHLASLTCFIMLFMSPFTFLLCITMEFFNLLLSLDYRNLLESLKKNISSAVWLLINTFSVAFMYLFLFKDIKTMAIGKTFTLEEMKALPELNPGGRHPIFDGELLNGNWFSSVHWGLPLGGLDADLIIILLFIFVPILSYLFFNKSKTLSLLRSNTLVLFYSSIALYFLAQITFPALYLPNRYISIPWLLLVLLLPFLFIKELINFLKKKGFTYTNTIYLLLIACLSVALYFTRMLREPGFVAMTPEIKAAVEVLPKDSIIAAHPDLHDINMVDVITKRTAFIDRERSVAYSKEILDEIRRRTIEAFKMTYSTSKDELVKLMEVNGVTHILVHKQFYRPKYLDNPVYLEPYNKTLKLIISKNRETGFYLKSLLKKRSAKYFLISLEEIKNS